MAGMNISPVLIQSAPSLGLCHHWTPVPLSASLTPLPGREREFALAAALLRRDALRLLTITEFGGSGKTRPAMEIARTAPSLYADGFDLEAAETVIGTGFRLSSAEAEAVSSPPWSIRARFSEGSGRNAPASSWWRRFRVLPANNRSSMRLPSRSRCQ